MTEQDKRPNRKNIIAKAGFVLFTAGVIMFAAVAVTAKPKQENQNLTTAIGVSGIFAILIGGAAWSGNLKSAQERQAEKLFKLRADKAHLARCHRLSAHRSREP